jgi:DNA (cytosine-5)-methyltransferase 1
MHKAVSLFAGAGGFCGGVRFAGFKVVCAVESDSYHGAALKRIKGDSSELQHFAPSFYADEPAQTPK